MNYIVSISLTNHLEVEAAKQREYDFARPSVANYFGNMREASKEKSPRRKPLWTDSIFKKDTAEMKADQAINPMDSECDFLFVEEHESKLEERMRHMSDTYSEYLMYLIREHKMENASHIYSYDKVKKMVEKEKEKYGWEFLFLGANIDAIEVAGKFGIGADRAINYECDKKGTALNFSVLSDTVSAVRKSKSSVEMDEAVFACCAPIREDYQRRHKSRRA